MSDNTPRAIMARVDARKAAGIPDDRQRAEWAESRALAMEISRDKAEAALRTVDASYGTLLAQWREAQAALKSIASNTCCDGCREAGLVAAAALRATERPVHGDEDDGA